MTRPQTGRCRQCGQADVDAHLSWCQLAGTPPLTEDPPLDEVRTDRAEDDYSDTLIGEFRESWTDRD